MSILNKLFGDPNEKVIAKIQPIVEEINKFEEKIEKLSDDQLKAKTEEFKQLDRVQKTFVISRNTLHSLCEVAEKFNTPRDALVEYSVQRLLPIIAEERQRHKKRKEILNELNQFLERGEEILERSRRILGDEDPVCDKLKGAISICRNAVGNIRAFVEKGEVIESFKQDDMDAPAVGYG